ncbi:guanylin-like [Diretmus argenteus]
MKTSVCVSVLLVALCQLSSAVTVTEGEFRFSLESVKELGVLMRRDDASAKQDVLVEPDATAVCSNPSLPQEFKALCQGRDAGAALARLASVAVHSDACEICESVACTGC